MKKKRKEHKILKRILPIICAVLCISTALITPISAIVDSSQGVGDNYDITARSPYPMTVGLAFNTSDKNVVFATDIGGFGQEFNTTLNGADSFYWTSEASTADELDGTLTYQFLDVISQGKEYRDLLEPLSSGGYALASYRPIKISAQSGTDLTQGKDCSSIVYRLQDVVINSSVIRKGNVTSNIHQDVSAEAVADDNIYSPNADDYRYLVPHVVLPTISDTSGYLGTYNVVASITDEWGNEWDFDYSIPIDTRGATSDTFVPFLPMSIFDSYDKSYGDEAYNIGMSNTVVLNDYYGYLDVDYYEYRNVIPDINLIVNLRAEVGGEDTIIKQEYLPLGEYVGQTFTEWIASVDGLSGYSFSAGAGPITMTYTDTENDFIYSGNITDGNGTSVYGSSVILDDEYRANLYREEVSTTDELSGTWAFNNVLTDMSYAHWAVNLTCNNVNYLSMGKGYLAGGYGINLYKTSTENWNEGNYTTLCTDWDDDDWEWYNEAYRTIIITSKLSEVTNGDALLTWLQANATKRGNSHSGGSGNDAGIEGPSADDGYDWGGALNEGPSASAVADTPTTTAIYEWVKVEGTEYGRSAMLMLPLWDTSNLAINGSYYNLYSFPTFQKFIDGAKTQDAIPVPEVDYTSWIGIAVGGFLNMELMPNFSIGGVLAILVGFSIVMLFLKFFAGG